jgi:hypothetical protein
MFDRNQSKSEPEKETILIFIRKWCGSDGEAPDWYNNEQIPAFNMKAREAVEKGSYEKLLDYLKSIAIGGFA